MCDPQMAAQLMRMQAAGQEIPGMPPLGDKVVGRTNEGRPAYQNTDGSMSTERTRTVTDPRINSGRPTNVPSIFDGKELDEDGIAEVLLSRGRVAGSVPEAGLVVDPVTGRALPSFPTIQRAEEAAMARSPQIEVEMHPPYRRPGVR